MALIKENDLTEGMSGKFGKKIVFRVVKGVTVAARRSNTSTVLTEKQIAHRDRFRQAANYAKAKMQDPVAKADYKQMAGDKAFASAFSAAVKDFLVKPEILSIDVADYKGTAGDTISVKVSNKTIRVIVSIVLANGSILESGDASLNNGDVEWKYITTKALASLAGNKIVATAIDRPGNETAQEKLLS